MMRLQIQYARCALDAHLVQRTLSAPQAWDAERFSALCLELRTLDILTIADGVLTEVLFDYIETHLKECVNLSGVCVCVAMMTV